MSVACSTPIPLIAAAGCVAAETVVCSRAIAHGHGQTTVMLILLKLLSTERCALEVLPLRLGMGKGSGLNNGWQLELCFLV